MADTGLRRQRRRRIAALAVGLSGAAALGGAALAGGATAQPSQIRPPRGAHETAPSASRPDRSARPGQAESLDRREPPAIDEARSEAERPRPQAPIVVPRTGPGTLVDIPLADGLPGGRLAPGELPPAWSLKRFAGRALFELTRDEGRPAFRLVSQASSFALHREVAIDLQQFPVLTWTWKVVRLPARGDARDQAAQVYVIFPRSPSPRTASDVLGYVWDTQAPVGQRAANPEWPNVRVIVLESGAERAGTWVREARNVGRDYAALFGKGPPAVGRVAVMTDSDHTRTATEAFFSELAFQRTEAVSAPEPSPRN